MTEQATAEPVIMPADPLDYRDLRACIGRLVPGCQPCATGAFGPEHWPLQTCRGGNGPGRPIRPHCTCDSCF